jgi:hypothetical protein
MRQFKSNLPLHPSWMYWSELDQYGAPTLLMFDERPFVDCIDKVDGNFVVGFGSCLVEML